MLFSNQTDGEECDTEALYGPGEVVTPAALLWLGLIHNICIAILGILGESVSTQLVLLRAELQTYYLIITRHRTVMKGF